MVDGAAVDTVVESAGDLPRLRSELGMLAGRTGVSIDDTLLATTELVTNALLYTPGGCRLRAWSQEANGPLRVEIRDRSAVELPPTTAPVPSATRGRGLLIVDAITSRWGVQIHDGLGKTVWFELDSTGAI